MNSRQRAVAILAKKAARVLCGEKGSAAVLGISDGDETESWARKYFGDYYTNVHFHKSPTLDLTDVADVYRAASDLVICSEVLEHVEPPVSRAFNGLSQVLKTGGFLVVSAPYRPAGYEHVEHFEELVDGQLIRYEGQLLWTGTNHRGEVISYNDLKFHGGEGMTLEFRVFSDDSLERHLNHADFEVLEKARANPLLGISWEPWGSRVWLARKTK
jgi:SAM-dependent methyltransferase